MMYRDLWGAIEPEEGQPVSKGVDAKARALLMLSVQEVHLPALEELKTAKEVWAYLANLHQVSNRSQQLQLRREFTALRMQEKETVTAYVSRARGLAAALTNAGKKVDATELVMQVLAGLPDTPYGTLCTVLAEQEDLSLDTVASKLMGVEAKHQTAIKQEQVIPLAMFAGASRSHGKRGGSAGQQSMRSAKDSQMVAGTDGKVKAAVECYHCHKRGHFADKCPSKEMGHSNYTAIAPKGFDSATSFFSF